MSGGDGGRAAVVMQETLAQYRSRSPEGLLDQWRDRSQMVLRASSKPSIPLWRMVSQKQLTTAPGSGKQQHPPGPTRSFSQHGRRPSQLPLPSFRPATEDLPAQTLSLQQQSATTPWLSPNDSSFHSQLCVWAVAAQIDHQNQQNWGEFVAPRSRGPSMNYQRERSSCQHSISVDDPKAVGALALVDKSKPTAPVLPSTSVGDDPVPWWWYPCYHADPDNPWYDSHQAFGGDDYWSPSACADHVYIACKMAVADANHFQEKEIASQWGTSPAELRYTWRGFSFDWLPRLPQMGDAPVSREYLINKTLDRALMESDYHLQLVSVPVEQIIMDEQTSKGNLLPVWYAAKTHLRQVLCELQCGLFRLGLPRRQVGRGAMPDSARCMVGPERLARDWIVFNAYRDCVRFYEQTFLAHTAIEG